MATLAIGAVAPALVQAKATAHTSAVTIKVAASEFKFVLSKKSAKPGKVKFVVTNKGSIQHDFDIAGHKTSLLSPGKSATLTVTLKKGSYKYMCTVPGHAEQGMKGTFKVS